jgi:hypothetical protein
MKPPRSRSTGQGVVEYGLILGGSAVVTVVTLVFLGPVLAEVLGLIGEVIDAATSGAY